MQADIHTDSKIDNHTPRQASLNEIRHPWKVAQAGRQVARHVDKRTEDRQAGRKERRQAGRKERSQAGGQARRQARRQTGRKEGSWSVGQRHK